MSFSLLRDAPAAVVYYDKLARDLAEARSLDSAAPLLLSVGGWPGSGKSTLVQYLASSLAVKGYRVADFSLDDVYLSKSDREQLARTVHPLLARRGVPGTHDTAMALEVVSRLLDARDNDITRLPRFDKLADERAPLEQWPVVQGRPDFIILDAWFWGAVPARDPLSVPSLNETERLVDSDGTWRCWVNAALGQKYPDLFAIFERHVQIQAPNWEASIHFRIEQERNLYASRGQTLPKGRELDLRAFLERFERVALLPHRLPEGHVFELDEHHHICRSRVVPGEP